MHKSGLVELEAVVAIARLGSFRAAAHDLDMSPQTLRVTPAMAAGVSKRLWEMTDIVDVLEAWETRM
jgi:hypothetical protein